MTKEDLYRGALAGHFDRMLDDSDEAALREYLLSNSNLPGPRANLELAGAFAETVETCVKENPQRLWEVCLALAQVSADETPTNDPREFAAFCGTRGVGAVGACVPSYFDEALTNLFELAHGPRWRVREAVAMGDPTAG